MGRFGEKRAFCRNRGEAGKERAAGVCSDVLNTEKNLPPEGGVKRELTKYYFYYRIVIVLYEKFS